MAMQLIICAIVHGFYIIVFTYDTLKHHLSYFLLPDAFAQTNHQTCELYTYIVAEFSYRYLITYPVSKKHQLVNKTRGTPTVMTIPGQVLNPSCYNPLSGVVEVKFKTSKIGELPSNYTWLEEILLLGINSIE